MFNINKKKNKVKFVIIAGCAGAGKTTIGKAISRIVGGAYIDKDTVTKEYTDYILYKCGSFEGDRESELYCNDIRNIEYNVTFKICEENLLLGNSVVLTIPFISQIQDYNKFIKILNVQMLQERGIIIKFIWINHDIDLEYDRIVNRAAKRDKNKIDNWEEYTKSVDGIIPDEKYKAYLFNNNLEIDFESAIREVIKWIKK